MGNVSKRQQPDHRTDNSRRSPTGLPGGVLQLAINKYIYTSSVIMNAILNFKLYKETKIKNKTRLTKARGS